VNRRSLSLVSIKSPSPSRFLSRLFLPAVYPLSFSVNNNSDNSNDDNFTLATADFSLTFYARSAIRATYATLTSDCTLQLLVSLLIFTTRETITITHRKLDTPLARRLRTPCCAFPSLSLSLSVSYVYVCICMYVYLHLSRSFATL
jgi:hypothetical protein